MATSQNVILDVGVSQFANSLISQYSSNVIIDFIDTFDYALDSTQSFGTGSTSFTFTIPSITSVLAFGTSSIAFNLRANSVISTAVVSNPTLGFKIYPTPVLSTSTISQHSIKPVITPLSINTTVNFGLPSLIGNIHRLLLFKDNNITKVANNDSVVIAGGIRINASSNKTSSAEAGSATLPSNPVGFISINIDGNDYKIPYYN